MSDTVINGAIGKSPLIDKMNQISVEQIKSRVPEQMENLVLKHGETIYQSVPISFEKCKKEMKMQLEGLKGGKETNGNY